MAFRVGPEEECRLLYAFACRTHLVVSTVTNGNSAGLEHKSTQELHPNSNGHTVSGKHFERTR